MNYPTAQAAEPIPWWALALTGVVSIAFGILAVAWPGITLYILVLLFGIQTLVTGAILGIGMFKAIGEHRTWWTYLILAVISIVAGVFILAYPGVTALAALYVIAFWAIIMGVFEIILAFTTGQFVMFLVGLLGIMVGFVLMANPAAGAVAFVIVIGIFAIVRGILLLIQAISQPAPTATA